LPADKIADVRSLLQHRFTHGASVARFLEDTSNRVRVETAWIGSDGQARPRQVTTFRVAPEDATGADRTDGAEEDEDGAARREQRLQQRSSRRAVNHQVAGTGWVMVPDTHGSSAGDGGEAGEGAAAGWGSQREYARALTELHEEMEKLHDVVHAVLWRRVLE
jgi:hypothetical protein